VAIFEIVVTIVTSSGRCYGLVGWKEGAGDQPRAPGSAPASTTSAIWPL